MMTGDHERDDNDVMMSLMTMMLLGMPMKTDLNDVYYYLLTHPSKSILLLSLTEQVEQRDF